MRKILLAAAMVLAVGVGQAKAATVHLSQVELDGFTLHVAGSTVPLPTFIANGGARYTASWCGLASCGGAVTGPVAANLRLTGVNVGSAGDTFVLSFINRNENTWHFSASINGGAFLGPVGVPAPDGTHTFTFAGIAGPVTQVDFLIEATLPLSNNDRTAEVQFVPEPASLLLLGAGLLGLAGVARRRR